MRKSIGLIIRGQRDKLNLTRAQAAKRLGISTTYLGHLECDHPVAFSENLLSKLSVKLEAPKRTLKLLKPSHDRKLKLWKKYLKSLKAKRVRE